MKKQFVLLICGLLFAGCLSGCNTATSQGSILPRGTASQGNDISSQIPDTSTPALAAVAEDRGDYSEPTYGEQFKPYEEFELTYDANKNELL